MTDYTYSKAVGNMPLNADLDGNPVPDSAFRSGQVGFSPTALSAADCTCIYSCADDPPTRCSLSGEWHVHPDEPCPVHPDAPGDR